MPAPPTTLNVKDLQRQNAKECPLPHAQPPPQGYVAPLPGKARPCPAGREAPQTNFKT